MNTPVVVNPPLTQTHPAVQGESTTLSSQLTKLPNSQELTAMLSPLKAAGLWPVMCPLCRRTRTVTLLDARPGPQNSTEYIFECSFDPHQFVVSVPANSRRGRE